jgi:non-ribosomal peptide synthetase component E (peptide arylation enzyme)
VTLGYWKRPELNAEHLIPDPFSDTPGATLYRTGDRARWRSDGMLEHLGRLDDQVKVRGFRVELGEIEAVLAEHPNVRQAAVHLWTVNADDVRIVACCVPVKAGALAPVSLRRHLRARLPEYMIPQHFLPVEAIPLLPNGKVDRRRLPIPVAMESAIGRHEAPADAVEATIAEIWTQLIQPARPVSRNDRFFEIGGYSLLALRALQQIEQNLGMRLDFHILIQQSLADIAQQCRAESDEDGAAACRVKPPFTQGRLSVPVFLVLWEIVALLEISPNAEMHTGVVPDLGLGAVLLRISAIVANAFVGGIDTFA